MPVPGYLEQLPAEDEHHAALAVPVDRLVRHDHPALLIALAAEAGALVALVVIGAAVLALR